MKTSPIMSSGHKEKLTSEQDKTSMSTSSCVDIIKTHLLINYFINLIIIKINYLVLDLCIIHVIKHDKKAKFLTRFLQ